MDTDILWERKPHTEAKHLVLKNYLNGWYPVMAYQSLKVRYGDQKPRLLVVDGFAGPGQYLGGKEGSPLIMLRTLLEHDKMPRPDEVDFEFHFIEVDRRCLQHLQEMVSGLGDLPANISVNYHHGKFRDEFDAILSQVEAESADFPPSFVFVDPFGYKENDLSLVGRFLDIERCESLTFLPLSNIHRFVTEAAVEEALDALFMTKQWREARDLGGDERKAFLMQLYEGQLLDRKGVECVRSFQLLTDSGNDYRLVFDLGDKRGLSIAKDAMWFADPVSGTKFRSRTHSNNDLVLFTPEEDLDTSPLLRELRSRFGTDWFRVEDALDCTLLDTPYREAHLRTPTLKPAEDEGLIEVDRPGDRGYPRAKDRPPGTKIRFKQ